MQFDIGTRLNDEDLKRKLERAIRRGHDFTPALEEIGEQMVASITTNFLVGGRPEKWPPLSLATLFARVGGVKRAFKAKFHKRREYSVDGLKERARSVMTAAKPLIDTGRLMKSITYKLRGRHGVAVGTNVVYGAIHQFGGKAGRGHSVTIPARPFLVVQDEDLQEIGEILKRHIAEALA